MKAYIRKPGPRVISKQKEPRLRLSYIEQEKEIKVLPKRHIYRCLYSYCGENYVISLVHGHSPNQVLGRAVYRGDSRVSLGYEGLDKMMLQSINPISPELEREILRQFKRQ